VKVELDRYWDLLRQRRAHEEFGLDPDNTDLRDESTVEGYEDGYSLPPFRRFRFRRLRAPNGAPNSGLRA
jgi:Protein of unknown function (DUF2630)